MNALVQQACESPFRDSPEVRRDLGVRRDRQRRSIRHTSRVISASVGESGCKKLSHSTDACDRSTLSGLAVNKNSRSSYSQPVSSSRTAPALISRLPLTRAAVPFGQWNVCNALWAPPVLVSRGAVDRSEPLGYLRSAAIAGPFEAVSRSGQPGLLGNRCRPLDHPRRAVNRWFRRNFSPLFCLAGDSMSGLQIPASDDLRRGSVLRFGADCTDVRSAWQTGAPRGCARDRARFGGNPAPTLWDATFKSVPQRRGAAHVSRRVSRPGGAGRDAAFRLRFAASRRSTARNRADRAPR